MKKTILIASLLLGGFMFQNAQAQVHVDVRFNVGTQPVWGPVGYDYVDYYYMPDIDVFLQCSKTSIYLFAKRALDICFIIAIKVSYYDINRGYKVVVNEPTPYRNAAVYRTKYAGYKDNHGQEIIRNSHDSRYWENKNHPEHNKWKGNQNSNGNGHGNGHKN
jgi:hypothetical protein